MYLLEFAGEDDAFAAAEARVAAGEVSILAPGLGTAEAVTLDRARDLAYTRRVGDLIDTGPADVDALVERLAAIETPADGSVAVRARDVRGTAGIDTQAAERRLGQVLANRGHEVDLTDPDRTLLALFADDVGTLAWELGATRRAYGDRAPTDRPFFQPGSMDPLLARAVVNLAQVEAGDVVLDPMCGTGGLLLEAGLLGARPIGLDAQSKMVTGARENLAPALEDRPAVARADATALPTLARADATSLPLRDGSVDAVVVDTPYGRQSKIATHDLEDLVRGALAEARRVASRAVVVADRDYGDLATEVGWTLRARHERRVHRSLTRHVHVLE